LKKYPALYRSDRSDPFKAGQAQQLHLPCSAGLAVPQQYHIAFSEHLPREVEKVPAEYHSEGSDPAEAGQAQQKPVRITFARPALRDLQSRSNIISLLATCSAKLKKYK
jgi:hypothetical protein